MVLGSALVLFGVGIVGVGVGDGVGSDVGGVGVGVGVVLALLVLVVVVVLSASVLVVVLLVVGVGGVGGGVGDPRYGRTPLLRIKTFLADRAHHLRRRYPTVVCFGFELQFPRLFDTVACPFLKDHPV